jgi:hypothetical protein
MKVTIDSNRVINHVRTASIQVFHGSVVEDSVFQGYDITSLNWVMGFQHFKGPLSLNHQGYRGLRG